MEEANAPPISIRRANKDDEKAIINLVGEEAFICRKRFGTIDVRRLIEVNFVSVVAIDSRYSGESACVGFACFHYTPTSLLDFVTAENCFDIANRNSSNNLFDVWVLLFFLVTPLILVDSKFDLAEFFQSRSSLQRLYYRTIVQCCFYYISKN